MEKKNKIYFMIAGIVTCIVVGLCVFAIFNQEEEEQEVTLKNDTEKFIEVYEGLNGVTEDDYTFSTITIDKDVDIFYKSDEEIVDVVKDETALIYFGFENCPWCRNMLGTLTRAAADKEFAIYYVDLTEIRNIYKLEGEEIVESKEGTEAYYELLDLLDEHLAEYNVYDTDGEKYSTDTKRIYAPNVVTVKDGVVEDFLAPGEEYLGDPNEDLTEEQDEILYDRYVEMIMSINGEICDVATEGC